MIKVEELHSKFEMAYNRQANNQRRYLNDVEKDELLNYAVFEYVELFTTGVNKNNWNIGFEVTQQRIDMLEPLVKSYPEEPSLNLSVIDGIYIADLTKTAFPLKSFHGAYISISECTDRINVDIDQHQDLNTARQNQHRKSSRAWKRCIGTIRNKKLFLYPDGTMTPLKAYLTYIKQPDRIALGTYPALQDKDIPNAQNLTKTDSDLPAQYIDIVVAIAVQEAHRRFSNYNDLQVNSQKITSIV